MRQKSGSVREPAEQVVKNIRRATRRHFSAEEKIRVVLEGLRGEDSIAELCRRRDWIRPRSFTGPRCYRTMDVLLVADVAGRPATLCMIGGKGKSP